MTKVCLIGYNPKDGYAFTNQQVFKRAFELRNCNISYIDFKTAEVNTNGEIISDGQKVLPFDLGVFVTPIFTIPTVSFFSKQNNLLDTLKTFNDTKYVNEIDAHISCSCKTTMYEYLRANELPYPKTSRLTWDMTDEDLEEAVVELDGFPIVLKDPLSATGKGVFLCNNVQEVRNIERTLRDSKVGKIPLVIQQYFSYSNGLSMNVRVIGEKVYPRITLSSPYSEIFKGNFAQGRGFVACKSIPELDELCVKATKALGLDTARLDVFVGEEGFSICEVNSMGSFIDSEMAWLTNTGEEFADYCLNKLNGAQ